MSTVIAKSMKFEITEGAPVNISEHPIPVYLPDRTVVGKATVVEGHTDAAVVIEVELIPSIVPSLISNMLVGLSFNYEQSEPLTKEVPNGTTETQTDPSSTQ